MPCKETHHKVIKAATNEPENKESSTIGAGYNMEQSEKLAKIVMADEECIRGNGTAVTESLHGKQFKRRLCGRGCT